MKKFMSLLILLTIFTMSCKNNDSKTTTSEPVVKKMKIVKSTDLNGKAYTSSYICPMHCEGSGLETPGKCPACNMDLVKNPNIKNSHDGHDHDHEHDGHMH